MGENDKMTNDQAVAWLRKHSVLAVFHADRIVLVLPYRDISVEALRQVGFKLEIRKGFALAYTEPHDDLADVVMAARHAWVSKLSPFDQVSEAIGGPTPPIKFDFRSDM